MSTAPPPGRPTEAFYDAIGGEAVLRGIVDAFYDAVETDPVLRPLYPDADLTEARRRLTLFLVQYWGGPGTYSEERGHPRLRLRHAPFVIGSAARDAWLLHMSAAVESAGLTEQQAATLLDYFQHAAWSLQNAPE